MESITNSEYQRIMEEFSFYLQVSGYSVSTVKSRLWHIRDLFVYLQANGIHSLNETGNLHLESFYQLQSRRENKNAGAGLKLSSINLYAGSLKKFLDFLYDFKQVSHLQPQIPCNRLEPPSRAILTLEEIELLYHASHQKIPFSKYPAFHASRNRAMLSLYYGCALRRNEGLNLRVEDIQTERQLVHVSQGKGNKERYVPASYTTIQTVMEYREERNALLRIRNKTGETLLINEWGDPCGEMTLSLALKRLAARTGSAALLSKQPGLHSLRHSIASHLLAAGMDMELIRRFLGHKSLDTTQIYTHLIN